MKKQVTYIDAAKLELEIRASGLPVEEKKGWVRVLGPKGRSVYVPKTKSVGRVDLSWGQHACMPGVDDLDGEERFGSVWAQLDMSLPEPEVLANFRLVLAAMAALPPRDLARRARSKGPADAKGWSFMREGDAAQAPASS